MKLGYLGIDQHGTHYHIKKHPRKELLEQLGCTHADKMYCYTTSGKAHTKKGYVIKGLWIDVYQVHTWGEVC